MGSGCCGRTYEGDDKLMMLRRKRSKDSDEEEQQSPLPKIDRNYTSLPNRFNRTTRRVDAFGLAGLENMGNTCYINAALQCILNCQPLIDYILSGTYELEINPENPEGSHGELTRAMADLTKAQWLDEFEVILPRHLIELIRDLSPTFTAGVQHDAHELLSFLLDQLHEDLNRAIDRTPVNQEEYPTRSEEKQAAKMWAQHLKRNSSVIVDLFQGQLKSTLGCLQCGYQSITFDTFMYLSLPIPKLIQRPTLQDCLTEFTKEEKLDIGWICPVCQKPVAANKKFDIWKVPPVLMFHLKRFHYTSAGKGKICKFVRYPIKNFDLSEYITGPQKVPPVYDLFAKTDHEGALSQGHYSAVCKNAKTQRWFLFDDERVEGLETSTSDLVTPRAYVLFYCKTSVSEYGRQAEDMPQLWPHFVSLESSRKPSVVEESLSTDQGSTEINIRTFQSSLGQREPVISTAFEAMLGSPHS